MKQHFHFLKQYTAFARRLLLAAALVVFSPVALLANAQDLQASPYLEIVAPAQVAVGEPIDITLNVHNALDIASYETTLLFDTRVAQFAGLQQRENDLKRIGRDVGPLAAIDLPGGVAIGLYTCPTEDCVTRQGLRNDLGARGSFHLAVVTMISNKPGTLEIRFDAPKFVDAAGNPVDVSILNPVINVQVGAAGEGPFYAAPGGLWAPLPATRSAPKQAKSFDLNGDGLVTHADVMEVAIEWTIARQSLNPCGPTLDLTRDINQDGCIDVADLQMMTAQYSPFDAKAPGTESSTAPQVVETTFVVNVIHDGDDANIGNGVCATAYNVCTLRAAIQEANAHSGADTINFNIPGGGIKTIQLRGRLPTLSDASGATTINGYTQPGSAPNTAALVSNAAIMIQIAGNGEDRHDGMLVTSSNNVIRGIAMYRLRRAIWVYGAGANANVIAGSFIGTDAVGNYAAPALVTDAFGIKVEQGSDRTRVGGTALADRNVISGNGQSGVAFWHEGTDSGVIQNNLIGTNPAANARRPNRRHGVDINYGSEANLVGGTEQRERNVISGNDYSGVEISHGAGTRLNRVIANFIGTDVSGQNAPAWGYNGYTGITLEDGVVNNTISNNIVGNNRQGGIQITGVATTNNQITANRVGISQNNTAIGNLLFGIRVDGRGNTIGPNNIVAYSQYTGIVLRFADSDFNRITQNSVFSNGALGIDLLPGGVTQNDPGDADSGPNENLNFPVITGATPQRATGTACAGCVVEVFIASLGAGRYGQGRTFVGSANADGGGNFVVNLSGVVAGNYLTATATDAAGNTSEFSLNRLVQ